MRKLLLAMSLVVGVMGVGTGTASAGTGPDGEGSSASGQLDKTVTVVDGTRVTGTAAAREPSPPGCDTGAFCAYERWPENGYGALKLETQGNFVGGAGWVTYAFNNGVAFPGADHVQLGFVWGDGTVQEICVHYNPGPGHKIKFGSSVIITRAIWRGEC